MLRPGLSVTEMAVTDLPATPTAVWTVRASLGAEFDDLIVISFGDDRATLVLRVGETVQEVNDSGFEGKTATLAVQLLAENSILQVPRGAPSGPDGWAVLGCRVGAARLRSGQGGSGRACLEAPAKRHVAAADMTRGGAQVHQSGLRHIRIDKRINEWKTPGRRAITVAATNTHQARAVRGLGLRWGEGWA